MNNNINTAQNPASKRPLGFQTAIAEEGEGPQEVNVTKLIQNELKVRLTHKTWSCNLCGREEDYRFRQMREEEDDDNSGKVNHHHLSYSLQQLSSQ